MKNLVRKLILSFSLLVALPIWAESVIERTTKSVVSVFTFTHRDMRRLEDFYQGNYPASLGSGVVLDSRQGHIITNYHVIEDHTKVVVVFSNGFYAYAEVIGENDKVDLALLKIDVGTVPPLTAIQVNNADDLSSGDKIYVIGNPHGLDYSVSAGVVSAVHRTLGFLEHEDWIQTDAAVNGGSSGGAMINEAGQLVGINAAGETNGFGGSSIGLNFAISSQLMLRTVVSMLDEEEIASPPLGIRIQDVINDQKRKEFGILNRLGVMITHVEPSSRASVAGVLAGDILLQANSVIPSSKETLGTYLKAL